MLSSMNRGSGAHCIELTTKAGGFVLNSAHVTVYDVLFTLGPARIGQPQFRRLAGHQRKRGGQRGGSEDQFYVAAWRPEVLNLLTLLWAEANFYAEDRFQTGRTISSHSFPGRWLIVGLDPSFTFGCIPGCNPQSFSSILQLVCRRTRQAAIRLFLLMFSHTQ